MSLTDPTTRLVHRAKQGDERSLELLMAQFQSLTRAIAADYFLPGADDDDLNQEALIGLWKAIEGYDPDRGLFAPFAATCIRRQLIDAVKAATKGNNEPMNERALVDDIDVEFVGDDLLDQIRVREELQELTDLAGELLSERERGVLSLYLYGYSYEEVAERLGVGRKSVDDGLRRTRDKLRGAR